MNPFEELLDISEDSISRERLIEAFEHFSEKYDDVSLPMVMQVLMEFQAHSQPEQPSIPPEHEYQPRLYNPRSKPKPKPKPKPKTKPKPRKKNKNKKH